MLSEKGGWGQSTNRPGRHKQTLFCHVLQSMEEQTDIERIGAGGERVANAKILDFHKAIESKSYSKLLFFLILRLVSPSVKFRLRSITPLARWRNWKWRRYGPFGGNGRTEEAMPNSQHTLTWVCRKICWWKLLTRLWHHSVSFRKKTPLPPLSSNKAISTLWHFSAVYDFSRGSVTTRDDGEKRGSHFLQKSFFRNHCHSRERRIETASCEDDLDPLKHLREDSRSQAIKQLKTVLVKPFSSQCLLKALEYLFSTHGLAERKPIFSRITRKKHWRTCQWCLKGLELPYVGEQAKKDAECLRMF